MTCPQHHRIDGSPKVFTSSGSLRCTNEVALYTATTHPARLWKLLCAELWLEQGRSAQPIKSHGFACPLRPQSLRIGVLVYSQDRQPLIELSLQVNLPVVELLQALSQVAPRTTEPAPPRSPCAQQRGNPSYGSGPHDATVRKQERPPPSSTWAEWYPNSDWQPAPEQHNSRARHSWETCPPASAVGGDQPQVSAAQREEQMQLLWALTDKTCPPQQRSAITAPQPCAHTQRKQTKETNSPPRSKANAAQSKRSPQTARGEKADDNDEFDPPARPGAHPKKCPVQ